MRDLLRIGTQGEDATDEYGRKDERPFGAAEELYAFAEAEPKQLRHKRLVEKTIGLYTSFKLLFPSALPCVDPFTGLAVGGEDDGKQITRPGDRYAGCVTFSLEVYGHDIHAGDNHEVLFRGNAPDKHLRSRPTNRREPSPVYCLAS